MRPDWDNYFLQITHLVSSRSTCIRRKVGAVVVKDNRILSTGYNGVPSGLSHCLDIGCMRDKLNIPSGERQELCRGLHAEQNAIIQGALYGISLKGSTIYITTQPCITCAKMIIQAGIRKIIYEGDYPDKFSIEMLNEADIEVVKLANKEEGVKR